MHSKVSPYYIVSFIFHNQSDSIEENLQAMEVHLHNLGYPGHCIHTEPIIRGVEVYETMSLEDRRKLFDAISHFTRKSHIRGKIFFYEKKYFSDKLPPPLSEPSTANQSPSCLTFPFLPSSIGKSTLFPSLFQPPGIGRKPALLQEPLSEEAWRKE